MSFKDNLREELNFQGFMIKDLAEQTGINQASLSNYLRENSSIPSADVAVKIAQALNVTVEYLVTGKNSKIIKNEELSCEVVRIVKKLNKVSKENLHHIEVLIDSYL